MSHVVKRINPVSGKSEYLADPRYTNQYTQYRSRARRFTHREQAEQERGPIENSWVDTI